ncbi:MAG: hypothetical protein ABI220_04645 [Candidatus Saccharimonadales bacterium]
MSKYIFPKSAAGRVTKFGVDLTLYNTDESSGVAYEQTELGHLQEWYDDVSTYQWFIIEGNGIFVLNDVDNSVQAGDLVVVPPKVRIHYFGKMKMVLVTTPRFDPKNEHQVRLIDPSEVPIK